MRRLSFPRSLSLYTATPRRKAKKKRYRRGRTKTATVFEGSQCSAVAVAAAKPLFAISGVKDCFATRAKIMMPFWTSPPTTVKELRKMPFASELAETTIFRWRKIQRTKKGVPLLMRGLHKTHRHDRHLAFKIPFAL